MMAVINESLDTIDIEWFTGACVGVVLASEGYPGRYKDGFPISGLNTVDKGFYAFHAGTRAAGSTVYTAGGRVLTLVAKGATVAEARKRVYEKIPRIHFEGYHYRTDIAFDDMDSE
jgi:phosphoribosylamine--glycine ligase